MDEDVYKLFHHLIVSNKEHYKSIYVGLNSVHSRETLYLVWRYQAHQRNCPVFLFDNIVFAIDQTSPVFLRLKPRSLRQLSRQRANVIGEGQKLFSLSLIAIILIFCQCRMAHPVISVYNGVVAYCEDISLINSVGKFSSCLLETFFKLILSPSVF